MSRSSQTRPWSTFRTRTEEELAETEDGFIHDEYTQEDIDWLRHVGKLLGVIPWSFKERWLMFLFRIKKWFKNLFSNI